MGYRQKGFTLIEIIVVFTLLAMMMAMIFAGLDSARRSAEKGEKRITDINEIRVVQGIIRHQLSRAMAIAFEETDDGTQVRFYGDEKSITFVSLMPGYLGSAGPHIQQIELVDDKNGKVLQYKHGILSNYDGEDEQSGFEDAEPIVLLENIDKGAFAFIETAEEGLPSDWLSELENPSTMPLLVQLDLTMNETAREQWPLLQVALQVDASAYRGHRRSSSIESMIMEQSNARRRAENQ